MSKTSLALGTLTFLLAAHTALGADGVLGAAPPLPPDLRPLLEIQSSTTSTDSLDSSDQRITIYQGGTLVLQDRNRPDPRGLASCDTTILALGSGMPAALTALKRTLGTGQVGIQRDCGLGLGFGQNLDYRLEWTSPRGRTNRFQFGTFYQSGCPAGVALIKKAVDDYVAAVLSAPGTKVVRSAPCL